MSIKLLQLHSYVIAFYATMVQLHFSPKITEDSPEENYGRTLDIKGSRLRFRQQENNTIGFIYNYIYIYTTRKRRYYGTRIIVTPHYIT